MKKKIKLGNTGNRLPFAVPLIECFVVLACIAIFLVLKIVLANKFALLNLYYIPVFLSGYYLGKKPAILTGFLSILMMLLFVIRWPGELLEQHDSLYMGLNLVLWASFLLLVSILISTLNENRQRRCALGTEELLERYLKLSIEGPDNHPARVAQLAKAIARKMHLPADFIASLEAAALLHDLKESKHGLRMIADSMNQGLAENKSFGNALPLIIAEEPDQPHQTGLAIGSKILSVADAFDEIANKFGTVEPMLLINDMERENKYDHAVTSVLRRLIQSQN